MKVESLITDEALKMVGQETEPVSGKVTEKDIRRFCYAVGDHYHAFFTSEEQDSGNLAQAEAPPLFYDIPTAGEAPLDMLREDGLPTAGRSLPLKTTQVMAGGKEAEFFEPMRPGDTITQVGRIADIYEKTGRSGQLVFVVYENRYTNQHGELVAVERNTGIHR